MSILSNSFIQYIIKFLKSKIEAKQDKLVSGTNIKTINGTSILGSGNIAIEGGDSTGDVDEGRLVWSEKAVSKGTIIDGIMYNAHQNGLAFMSPSCIDVYYSTDNGDTWQDYGLTTTQKVYLVTPVTGNYNLYLGKDSTNKSVNYRLRIDLKIKDANIQFTGKKLYLRWLSNTSSDAYYIDISVLKYENRESNEWTHIGTYHKKNTLTIPLNETMGYNGAGGTLSLRIEAYRTGTTEPTYNSALTNIAFLYTAYSKGNNFGRTGLPMTIDTSQNSIFPAYIKARKFIPNGGKSTQVLKGDGSLEEESNLSVATAIDAEHAQEADYAGVADKAEKLATARTISLGGAARGSTTFDGSTGREINVTTLYEAFMLYGGKAIAGDISPIDGAAVSELWCNKFAYYNPDYINVEYTNNYSEDSDGNESSDVIWTEYPYVDEVYKSNKLFALTTSGLGNFYSSGSSSNGTAIAGRTRLRVTFNSYDARYLAPKKLLIRVGASAQSLNNQIKVEVVSKTDYDAGNENKFTHHSTNVVSGDAGWNSMSFASSFGTATYAAVKKLRITFIVNGIDATNRAPILQNIYMIGKHHIVNDDNLAATGHLYKFDYQKNMEVPAALAPITSKTQNIGYASRPWKNVYAQKHITDGGTNQQVLLGDGSLKALSEISPITDADAEILLDNHIHSIDVNANGNDVNISVIESSKSGNTWETEDNDITIPLATATSAGVMSKEDKVNLEDLTKDGYVYPTNYLANWNGNSTIEVDDNLQIELDNITSYNSNTEGLIFTVNIQTPSQHDGEDYIYLSLYDSDENELAYMEHLITDDDCHNGSLQLELKCPLAAITSGYILLYNNTNEPINIANPILKRYEVRNVRDISDKLLEKIGDINTILESIINS